MEIKRTIQKRLSTWKKAPDRKPLILQGARQVGKTWLLKHFGATEFESMAYFNFEEQPDLKQFFENTKDYTAYDSKSVIGAWLYNITAKNARHI